MGECYVRIYATKVGFIPTLVENLVQSIENEKPLFILSEFSAPFLL